MPTSAQIKSDARLLAQVLGMRHQITALESALARQGSLRALLQKSASEIDLGPWPSIADGGKPILMPKHRQQLRMAQALVLRYLEAPMPGALVQNPLELKPWLLCHLGGLPHERFGAAFIDARGRLAAIETLFQGTLTQTHVYPRELAARALQLNAARLVLFHNHPSGSPTHSAADLRLTEALGRQLAPLDIAIWDHLIVAGSEVVGLPEGSPWAARWVPTPSAGSTARSGPGRL